MKSEWGLATLRAVRSVGTTNLNFLTGLTLQVRGQELCLLLIDLLLAGEIGGTSASNYLATI